VPDTPSRLAVLIGGLVVALLAGFGIGRATSPPGSPQPPGAQVTTAAGGHVHGGVGTDVGGVSMSSAGYTMAADSTVFPAGAAAQPFAFRIVGSGRRPVTGFAVVHDKPMHLVLVRHDLTGYQHLHPTMAADGTWTVPLALPSSGVWRAYADCTVVEATGQQVALTLAVDIAVAGSYHPVALPAPARESSVADYTVTLEGTPQAGAAQPLLLRVFRGGTPVTELERYLGAYGHLVVVRDGDLGYLHVHPDDQLAAGAVRFWVTAPSPGRYRAFFDFQSAGTVHTAEFTIVAG
jgi:hypothetical protein